METPTDPTSSDLAPGDETPADTPAAGENACPRCGGEGRQDDGSDCPACGGTGSVVEGVGGG